MSTIISNTCLPKITGISSNVITLTVTEVNNENGQFFVQPGFSFRTRPDIADEKWEIPLELKAFLNDHSDTWSPFWVNNFPEYLPGKPETVETWVDLIYPQ